METCIKHEKKKQDAKESLRKTGCPSCRFCFFRVLCVKRLIEGTMRRRRVRRRGKPLVLEPYVETSAERNDQYRCKVKREQPFRSATNDVCQACNRCNTDFQFLLTAPLLPQECVEEVPKASAFEPGGSKETTSASEHGGSKEAKKAEKTAGAKRRGDFKDAGAGLVALGVYLGGAVSAEAAQVLQSTTDAFRKAMAMDYYITKYQSKMMEASAPLFKTLLPGIRRLAAEQEQEEAEEKARTRAREVAGEEPQTRKRRRTMEEIRARARKHVLRLASAANRCYWLSIYEVAIQILTGGDCVQSHKNERLFTRQLTWAL